MALRIATSLRLLGRSASSIPPRHLIGYRAAKLHTSRPVCARDQNENDSEASYRDVSHMNGNSDVEALEKVMVGKVPEFAIAEDVQTLFEESGIAVDYVKMRYDPFTGWNKRFCFVHLRPPSTPMDAIKHVDGAALFDRRIAVAIEIERRDLANGKPNLRKGWYAAKSSDLRHVQLRDYLFEYPADLFGATREGRHIVVENFGFRGNHNTAVGMYALFYGYNVMCLSEMKRYVPKDDRLNGCLMHIHFATREEADMALGLNGSLVYGRPVVVARGKIPLKYTASWDNSRPSGHNQSDRDSGSAVGSNFEEMQEELFRKWVLGTADRKLWVPSHSYRRIDKKK